MSNQLKQESTNNNSPGSSNPAILNGTDLSRSYGTNWNKTTVATMFDWLAIASFKIACLELACNHYRAQIRNVTILGLILSTLSGTVSVSNFNFSGTAESIKAQNIINGVFTVLSFTIAISTGYLKVYQIQENLETFIKLKQDWVIFSTSIASELQLPIELRRDALWIIIKNKTIYLDLLKTDVSLPNHIYTKVKREMPQLEEMKLDVSKLSNIIFDIGAQEIDDIQKVENKISMRDKFGRNLSSSSETKKQMASVVENFQNRTRFKVSSLANNSLVPRPSALPTNPPEASFISLTITEEDNASTGAPALAQETTLPPQEAPPA